VLYECWSCSGTGDANVMRGYSCPCKCPDCDGLGLVLPENYCSSCGGTGRRGLFRKCSVCNGKGKGKRRGFRQRWLILAESHLTRRLLGTMVRRIDALTVATG
jgi:hypothetical protein